MLVSVPTNKLARAGTIQERMFPRIAPCIHDFCVLRRHGQAARQTKRGRVRAKVARHAQTMDMGSDHPENWRTGTVVCAGQCPLSSSLFLCVGRKIAKAGTYAAMHPCRWQSAALKQCPLRSRILIQAWQAYRHGPCPLQPAALGRTRWDHQYHKPTGLGFALAAATCILVVSPFSAVLGASRRLVVVHRVVFTFSEQYHAKQQEPCTSACHRQRVGGLIIIIEKGPLPFVFLLAENLTICGFGFWFLMSPHS